MQQNSSILIAAAFTMIGFALGRVTAPPPPSAPAPPGVHSMEWVGDGGVGDVEVIVKRLEGEGFEGDTVFAIPGGEIRMVRHGEEVEVEVDMEVEMENTQEGNATGEQVVVQKKVIMVTSDED